MRRRIDLVLVERGLFESRARARAAIEAGGVTVAGRTVRKAAEEVEPDAEIAAEPAHPWVSRAALKLVRGLEAFGFDADGRVCLDIGASTGGFSQVLLSRGAAKVHAVDVGHGQLHARVADDPRIVSLEGVNARDLSAAHVPEPVSALVCDVSFISLKLALPPALALAAPGAWGVFLVKPQFEIGRAGIGKGGIVRDAAAAERSAEDIAAWLEEEHGWKMRGLEPSPILGGDGNREFLLGAER